MTKLRLTESQVRLIAVYLFKKINLSANGSFTYKAETNIFSVWQSISLKTPTGKLFGHPVEWAGQVL